MMSHQSSILTRAKTLVWLALFLLSALEGAAALFLTASLPTDEENARLFGFSPSRLTVMAVLIVSIAGFVLLALGTRKPAWRSRWLMPDSNPRLFRSLFILLPLIALISGILPSLLDNIYRSSGDFRYFAYEHRLLPLLVWFSIVSLQLFAWIAWSGNFHWSRLREKKPVFLAGLVVWGVFGLVAAFALLTGIGIVPDQIKWGKPTVSLLEWQIWLAWLAGIVFLLFSLRTIWKPRWDWIAALTIWLLAAGVWLSQPVPPSFFATAGRPPNFEIYPFSDGAYYGSYAQSVLIGNGFMNDQIPPRPLYISLLAIFHMIAGQQYEQVIVLQTLMLAFFPVILFFLGKELHSRAAGLTIALLAILRELTAIITTPVTNNASNSKLFFADLPAALFISLWALWAVQWLKDPGKRKLLALLVGGGMGWATLVRTQSVFMLPCVLLLALLALRWHWRAWAASSALVLAGLVIAIAPWLVRNYSITGQLSFDDPKTQTGVMAQHYSTQGKDLQYIIRPDEDINQFSSRVEEGIVSFTLAHPGYVAQFITAHWINSGITTALELPIRSGITHPIDLLMPSRPIWEDWTGAFSAGQAVLFVANLGLIALGVGAAWARLGWSGLALLLMNASYNFSNAVARNSGSRYLIPVDWMIYAYAAFGLLEIAAAVLLVLGISPGRAASTPGSPSKIGKTGFWKPAGLVALAILLVGSLPVVLDQLIPQRYPDQSQDELAQEILNASQLQNAGALRDSIQRLASDTNTVVLKGRILYPRFYAAGEGEPQTAKTGYEPLNYPRTVFLVTSNTFNGLMILRSGQTPGYLPNASDVMILACPADKYMDARVVIETGKPGGLYLSSEGVPERCPEQTVSLARTQ